MAGEIQLNSTTMATESSGSITAQLDTIRPNTTNGSLTLQGDSSDAGVTGLTIDSSGNATFAQTISGGTIGSSVVFPAGHIIQFAQSFTETGGGVIGNLSSVSSGSPSTILTATINNVLASSKVYGFFYTGYMVLNSGQFIRNNITGGSINTDYYNQSGSGNGGSSPTFFFYDDAPGTGTNSYVLTGYSNASGNAAYWCSNGGYAYGWMLFEVAQ